MEVIILKGTEDRLYEMVAKLIMNPAILRQNNNYPFKTSLHHTWHICVDDGIVTGFMPVKDAPSGLYIDNYYISGDAPEIIDLLINSVMENSSGNVSALVHKRHVEDFIRHGFKSCTNFTKYEKMQHLREKGDDR